LYKDIPIYFSQINDFLKLLQTLVADPLKTSKQGEIL